MCLFKYLGDTLSEKVKAKVIAMLYSWTVSLPDEAKISQAYQMLKSQGENDVGDFQKWLSQGWNRVWRCRRKPSEDPLLSFVILDVLSADPEISLDADASMPSLRQQSPVFGDEKKNKVRTFMGLDHLLFTSFFKCSPKIDDKRLIHGVFLIESHSIWGSNICFVSFAVDLWMEVVFSGSQGCSDFPAWETTWRLSSTDGSLALFSEVIRATEEQKTGRSARGQSAHQKHG